MWASFEYSYRIALFEGSHIRYNKCFMLEIQRVKFNTQLVVLLLYKSLQVFLQNEEPCPLKDKDKGALSYV